MNKLKLIALTLLPLMAAGCTKSSTSQDPEPPSEPTPPVVIPSDPVPDGVISDITRGSIDNVNAFGLDLLRRSLGNDPGNRCMSPVSISAVLTMLANGDTRGSRDEILSVLGFNPGEEGLADLNFFHKTMLSCLPTLDPATTYSFTNSYWHDPRVVVRDDYAARIADVMFASVFHQTPGGVEGMKAVNKFVEENTNGLIKDFIKKPLDITSACLNTIYFKGEWYDPFSEEVTREDDFLNIDGTVSKAMFMRKMGVEYAETDEGTRAVRLPYGNGSFYMTAILPSDKINHVPLLECLEDDLLEKIGGQFDYQRRLVVFPKFECENNDDIIETLNAMGIVKACDPDYGLNAITVSGATYLKIFLHATKLKVNEDGTEGAAASMGGMDTTAFPDPEPTPELEPITFDRPFIYLIQEKTTGSIIFIGTVAEF